MPTSGPAVANRLALSPPPSQKLEVKAPEVVEPDGLTDASAATAEADPPTFSAVGGLDDSSFVPPKRRAHRSSASRMAELASSNCCGRVKLYNNDGAWSHAHVAMVCKPGDVAAAASHMLGVRAEQWYGVRQGSYLTEPEVVCLAIDATQRRLKTGSGISDRSVAVVALPRGAKLSRPKGVPKPQRRPQLPLLGSGAEANAAHPPNAGGTSPCLPDADAAAAAANAEPTKSAAVAAPARLYLTSAKQPRRRLRLFLGRRWDGENFS
jgi:hypothetical protein